MNKTINFQNVLKGFVLGGLAAGLVLVVISLFWIKDADTLITATPEPSSSTGQVTALKIPN